MGPSRQRCQPQAGAPAPAPRRGTARRGAAHSVQRPGWCEPLTSAGSAPAPPGSAFKIQVSELASAAGEGSSGAGGRASSARGHARSDGGRQGQRCSAKRARWRRASSRAGRFSPCARGAPCWRLKRCSQRPPCQARGARPGVVRDHPPMVWSKSKHTSRRMKQPLASPSPGDTIAHCRTAARSGGALWAMRGAATDAAQRRRSMQGRRVTLRRP